MVLQGGAALVCFGLYFVLVFGHVSRRFERQADVFGCRAVSCGQEDCPPHDDIDRRSGPVPARVGLCPVGIRIFANALANVAALNGMEPAARSWRHGSIARRIAFLEGLEGKPEVERRFQLGVSRLRVALGLALLAVLAFAVATGEIGHLR
jgi:STE24 endopeptidase